MLITKTMAQLTIVDRLGSGSFGYVMRIKLFHFLETGDFDNVLRSMFPFNNHAPRMYALVL